jgi:hypothetical protein
MNERKIICALENIAEAIRCAAKVHAPRKTIRLVLTSFYIVHKPSQPKGIMINTSCRNTEKIVVTLAPVDEDGKVEKLDGNPTAKILTGSGTVKVVDGLTVEVIPNDGFVGELSAEIDADAAAGPRVNVLTETIVVDVVAPEVVPKDAVTLGATVATVPKVQV